MKNLLSLLFILSVFTSCQKEFEVDNSNYKSKLVLNNLFQQNTPFEIVISKSVNVFDTSIPSYLTTANVKLFVNNSFAESLTSGGSGYYFGNTIPAPGKTYKVVVSNPGFEDIEAENVLPNPVAITNWSYIDSTMQDNNGDYYGELSFTIIDPIEDNRYLLSFQFYDVVRQEYLFLRSFESDDQSLNQNLAKRLDNGEYLFTDNLFNGKQKSFLLQIPSGFYQTKPNYLLKLYSLSKDAYFYGYTKPDANSNSFNTSPIYSNVKNGLGIFAGRSLFVDTIR